MGSDPFGAEFVGEIDPDPIGADDYIANLDDRIDEDPGYPYTGGSLDTLAKMYLRDKPAWGRVADILRQRGLFGDIRRAVMEHVRANDAAGELSQVPQRIADLDPDAPVDESAGMPPGWTFVDGAIYRLVAKRKQGATDIVHIRVTTGLYVVSAISVDRHSKETHMTIAWAAPGSGGWRKATLPKRKITSARSAGDVLGAHRGVHVNPANISDLCMYLSEYASHNAECIEHKIVSSQLGWQGGSFLLGNDSIGTSGIEFCAPDAGEEQIASALGRKSGTRDGWVDAIDPIKAFPRVELALYASLAAPLLKPIRGRNFVIEWCGATSSGKTTAIEVAASVWGNPDTRASTPIIGSWGATKIGIEKRMALLNDLPCILDDTKLARVYGRGYTIVPAVVYAAVNGQGDARGSVDGMRQSAQWRTVVLSTGEQRLVDYDKSAGTAARILTLWGSPFEGPQPRRVDDVHGGLSRHHGHIGAEWVRWIMDHSEDWGDWVDMRIRSAEKIVGEMGPLPDQGVGVRVADCLAILDVTCELARNALGLGWSHESPARVLASTIAGELGAARRDVEAYEEVVSWLASNASKILDSPLQAGREPAGGWIGKSLRGEGVALFPPQVESFLADRGYEPRGILRHWRDNGIIETDGTRMTKKMMVDGQRVRVIVLRLDGVNDTGDLPF